MDMAGLMSMSGGMDMGSNIMFQTVNSALARSYWYGIVGVLSFTMAMRLLKYIQTSTSLRTSRSRAVRYPTKPRNRFAQAYATVQAIFRELAGPELLFSNRWWSWLSPPSLGRSVLLLGYWAVLIYLLTTESVVLDAYYWERIGFRAAWISATQVPFVFLLASKSSIIGFLSGSSHDRLNWMHRWVSRTLLATVTIHGAFFWQEWTLADFVNLELAIMPMVRYGLGAWFVLLWTFLSSLTPIRRLSYELFVLQHLAAACVFLWLIYVHVPSYAQYNVWFAIAALVFDKAFLLCLFLWDNINVRYSKKIGHDTEIRNIDDDATEVVIRNVGFSWKAGQHIYLRIPTMAPLEAHPFTIANVHQKGKSNDVQLIVKAKSGFTRRLYKKGRQAHDDQPYTTTTFVTGPFGCPPDWRPFETVLLISSSTGSSFTLPILESILSSESPSCVTRIDVLMVVRNRKHIAFHLPRLDAALARADARGIALNITAAITCPCDHVLRGDEATMKCSSEEDDLAVCKCGNKVPSAILLRNEVAEKAAVSESETALCCQKSPDEKAAEVDISEKVVESSCCARKTDSVSTTSSSSSMAKTTVDDITVVEKALSSPTSNISSSTPSLSSVVGSSASISYTIGRRPDIASFIRGPIEATGGETGVAVCGGRSVVAVTRNAVARLSDERAVHKGSGAQGIMLHSEGYCF